MSYADCAQVIDTFLEVVVDQVKQNKHIELREFGTFFYRIRKPRPGRDIKRNIRVTTPSFKKMLFRFSPEVRNLIAAYQAKPAPGNTL